MRRLLRCRNRPAAGDGARVEFAPVLRTLLLCVFELTSKFEPACTHFVHPDSPLRRQRFRIPTDELGPPWLRAIAVVSQSQHADVLTEARMAAGVVHRQSTRQSILESPPGKDRSLRARAGPSDLTVSKANRTNSACASGEEPSMVELG